MIDSVRVYDVHTQAREKLFNWIRPLSQEQYTQEFPFGLKTLRLTMVELAAVELFLAMRLREEAMPRPFRLDALPINETTHGTFPEIEVAWREQVPRTRSTLASIKDWDKMIETVLYGKTRVYTESATRRDIATQILLHEVHHRAQAMAMLRQLGVPAQDVDYIFFVEERSDKLLQPA